MFFHLKGGDEEVIFSSFFLHLPTLNHQTENLDFPFISSGKGPIITFSRVDKSELIVVAIKIH